MTGYSDLSIVVPIGPGDTAWQGLLDELACLQSEPEIILSACRPQPAGIVLPDNIQWVQGRQGRALQLNAGANLASRPVLWLLHADSRFTEDTLQAAHHFLSNDEDRIGYFRLNFADDGPLMTRANAWFANLRSRFLHLPFGDQGFILKQSLFKKLQGFDEKVMPGEDLDFVVRARAFGVVLQELPAELITSARRYRQYGWLATTVRHIVLTWRLTRQARLRLANNG